MSEQRLFHLCGRCASQWTLGWSCTTEDWDMAWEAIHEGVAQGLEWKPLRWDRTAEIESACRLPASDWPDCAMCDYGDAEFTCLARLVPIDGWEPDVPEGGEE